MRLDKNEIERIRELAKRQAEIASLPVMEERKRKWYRLNNGEASEPLVSVEFGGPPGEFFPDCVCETPEARAVEWQLLRNIIYHERIDDDRVIPAYFQVPVSNSITPFGLEVKHHFARYSDGRASMGYAFEHPVKDLERDFAVFGETVFNVDAELTAAKKRKEDIDELLGGILPARVMYPTFSFGLGYTFCSIMGMEAMFTSLYDYPELFHKLIGRLTDDILEFMRQIEEKRAMLPNGDGSHLSQGSWSYTDDLPPADSETVDVTFKDVWGYANFQETVGMGVPMFDEFFFSYMERISERFGLFSYGCCEPVDGLWDKCLSRLSNLRKLSVSAFCDEESIAERIRGRKIVYHRKPSANFISVDTVFDDEAFGRHIRKSAETASGCPLEVTFREELTVRGEPWRLRRAVDITREQFVKYWKS